MFGISFEELIVLLILALILFGPEKLPEYGEKLGRLVAKLREATSEITQPRQSARPPYEPPQSAKEGFCPICGQILGYDFTFCPKCGRRLKETPGPEQPLVS